MNANEFAERYQLLVLFYSQRRRNFKQPGIGPGSLVEKVDFSPEVLEFHLWYFQQKGWIEREEGGQLSITASGVDQADSMHQQAVTSQKRQEQNPQPHPQLQPQLH